MVEMSEQIVKYVNGKNGARYRNMLKFCLEPKEYIEVLKGKFGGGDPFKLLVDLKGCGALGFDNGKYYTTYLAKEIVKEISVKDFKK